ncbi:glycosyltransferase [Corynebacterium lehmanniae]|uniref:glycosyltransferase n=1 Tax=Corynebacterium haemomassiliense TaxID=2754726 RepID=UPI00370D9698
MKTVSVVIGFKDWGLDRLGVSLASLVPQVEDAGGEVIVVDYGSAEPEAVQSVVESAKARLVRVENGDPWSRSRALNAGFAESNGKVLISTDADMIFTPNAISGILQRFDSATSRVCILQCKDLPEQMNADYFATLDSIDFEKCESESLFRPRYGMGGMIACTREAFLRARGFDERMHTYGGEDIDFAQRLRKLGYRFDWINDPQIAIYHIWHPSSRAASESSQEGSNAIRRNSEILLNDQSPVRNLTHWMHRPADATPLVSVVISTKNRVGYLKEALASVFTQTVQDFQLIVIDDGSDDTTWEFLTSIRDPRVTIHRTEGIGLAAARNIGTDLATAEWIIIHDDDDIMLPTRIEDHFAALTEDVDGTYGGWVDFEDRPGGAFEVFPGRKFSEDAVRFGGQVYLHPTLMLRRSLMQTTRYDETFRSGSDLNMALRMLRNGMSLKHTGKLAILRRLHDKQVTHADSSYQRASWATSKQFGHPSSSLPQTKFKRSNADKQSPAVEVSNNIPRTLLTMYGPDSWANRKVFVYGKDVAKRETRVPNLSNLYSVQIPGKDQHQVWGIAENSSWSTVFDLADIGYQIEFFDNKSATADWLLRRGLWNSVETLIGTPGVYLVKTSNEPDEEADYPALELVAPDDERFWVNIYSVEPEFAPVVYDLVEDQDFLLTIEGEK